MPSPKRHFYFTNLPMELYNHIKIFHIFSATFLLSSMVYSYYLWQTAAPTGIGRIQTQTLFIILPCALIQLMTGFSMISLEKTGIAALWIKGSVGGFLLAMGCWFAFIYCLLAHVHSARRTYYNLQVISLTGCLIGIISMLFFMANKTQF